MVSPVSTYEMVTVAGIILSVSTVSVSLLTVIVRTRSLPDCAFICAVVIKMIQTDIRSRSLIACLFLVKLIVRQETLLKRGMVSRLLGNRFFV